MTTTLLLIASGSWIFGLICGIFRKSLLGLISKSIGLLINKGDKALKTEEPKDEKAV